MNRLLGLDVGEKRIGVALGDPTGTVASPHSVIERKSTEYAIQRIVELVDEHGIDSLVVGCPIRTDGTRGPEYDRVAKFCDKLGKAFAGSAPRIILWDERFTTLSAHRSLIEGKVRRSRRTQVVDKVAASIMLQAYLDASRGGEGHKSARKT